MPSLCFLLRLRLRLGLRLGLGSMLRFGLRLGFWSRCSSVFLLFSGGWSGVGWLEKSDINVISTQVVVEVEGQVFEG